MGLKLIPLCDISIDIVFSNPTIMHNTFQDEDKSSGEVEWRLHWTVVCLLCSFSAPSLCVPNLLQIRSKSAIILALSCSRYDMNPQNLWAA